MYIEY